jgi:hypothetical protein
MKHLFLVLFASLFLVACDGKKDDDNAGGGDGGSWQDDKDIDKDKA